MVYRKKKGDIEEPILIIVKKQFLDSFLDSFCSKICAYKYAKFVLKKQFLDNDDFCVIIIIDSCNYIGIVEQSDFWYCLTV